MRPALPAAPALLLLAAAAFAAAEPFAYARWFEPAGRGSGLWGGKFVATATDKELDGLVLVADWWEGPGDLRAGDDAKSVLKDVVFEVKRGDGAWVALPPAERDLRLRARVAAPAETKSLRGGSPAGEWTVRQAAGGEYARHVRVEFTLKGDPLLVTDLAVDDLRLPGLDAPPKVGRPHLPDRQDTPKLGPDQAFTAIAVVRNAGARKTKECDIDLFAAPWGARKGAKRVAFAAIPALAPGGSAEVKVEGRIPADAAVSGPWEIWVVADPRAALRETESLNNVLGRGVTVDVPPPKEARPLDDR